MGQFSPTEQFFNPKSCYFSS